MKRKERGRRGGKKKRKKREKSWKQETYTAMDKKSMDSIRISHPQSAPLYRRKREGKEKEKGKGEKGKNRVGRKIGMTPLYDELFLSPPSSFLDGKRGKKGKEGKKKKKKKKKKKNSQGGNSGSITLYVAKKEGEKGKRKKGE